MILLEDVPKRNKFNVKYYSCTCNAPSIVCYLHIIYSFGIMYQIYDYFVLFKVCPGNFQYEDT